mmetsp:Transcript_90813/g.265848  ORF Transcript_90813/g.265848 Transcript_90813/m.265848 type:complete len:232 (-) Transcript_90813:170-865(-)
MHMHVPIALPYCGRWHSLGWVVQLRRELLLNTGCAGPVVLGRLQLLLLAAEEAAGPKVFGKLGGALLANFLLTLVNYAVPHRRHQRLLRLSHVIRVSQQPPGALELPGAQGVAQRNPLAGILPQWISAGAEQMDDRLGVAKLACSHQRSNFLDSSSIPDTHVQGDIRDSVHLGSLEQRPLYVRDVAPHGGLDEHDVKAFLVTEGIAAHVYTHALRIHVALWYSEAATTSYR